MAQDQNTELERKVREFSNDRGLGGPSKSYFISSVYSTGDPITSECDGSNPLQISHSSILVAAIQNCSWIY